MVFLTICCNIFIDFVFALNFFIFPIEYYFLSFILTTKIFKQFFHNFFSSLVFFLSLELIDLIDYSFLRCIFNSCLLLLLLFLFPEHKANFTNCVYDDLFFLLVFFCVKLFALLST